MKVLISVLLITAMMLTGCDNKQEGGQDNGGGSNANEAATGTEGAAVEKAPAGTPTPAPVEIKKDVAAVVKKVADQAGSWPTKLGDPAWSIEGLKWIKGGPVEFKPGTVYVVEFWATWCPPCRTSIPHLTKVQQEYKDKDVVVIGISKEGKKKVEPFVKKMGDKMDYAVAINPSSKVYDGYMKAFKRKGIPSAFIVDGEGKIVWVGHPMNGMGKALKKVTAG